MKNPFKNIHLPHHEGSAVLKVQGLTLKYENKTALDHISFDVQKGEKIAVVGPNGAGKSTLFKIISGIIRQNSGEVNIYGSKPEGHICIAYVPQRSQVDWNFPTTVFDVVMMGRTSKIGLFKMPRRRDRQLVMDALKIVNMDRLSGNQISELSGGQQQRVFVARALAQEAELMLMDEPLTGLDIKSQEDIYTILNMLSEKQVTILVSLHDMKSASEKFSKVMLLNKKLLGIGSPDEVFTTENLSAAYSNHLHVVSDKHGGLLIADTCCDHGEHNHD